MSCIPMKAHFCVRRGVCVCDKSGQQATFGNKKLFEKVSWLYSFIFSNMSLGLTAVLSCISWSALLHVGLGRPFPRSIIFLIYDLVIFLTSSDASRGDRGDIPNEQAIWRQKRVFHCFGIPCPVTAATVLPLQQRRLLSFLISWENPGILRVGLLG